MNRRMWRRIALVAVLVAGSQLAEPAISAQSDAFPAHWLADSPLSEDVRQTSRDLPSPEPDVVGSIRFVYGQVQFDIPRVYVLSRGPTVNHVAIILINAETMKPVRSEIGQPVRLGEDWPNLQFFINVGVPDTDFYFGNILKYSPTSKKTKFGYFDLYSVGPEDARSEIYTKVRADGYRILLDCVGNISDTSVPHHRVCSDQFPLIGNAAGVTMRFPYEQLDKVPELETKIRMLMDSFRVQK